MELRVMSFNLRVDAEQDGINRFPAREERILSVLREEMPDLIGFQEATGYSRAWLRERISDKYTVLGCGRASDYRGEGVCVAFLKQKFELLSFETQFFSLEPRRAGSRHAWSDQSQCPRMFVRAELVCEGISAPFHLFNTHLDHKGQLSQQVEMVQLLQAVSACQGKFVLTGDLNALPDSPVIAMPGQMQGRRVCEASAPVLHTFHGYGTVESCKIDYIFTDANPVAAYAVSDPHPGGRYISDHYPICAVIDFE